MPAPDEWIHGTPRRERVAVPDEREDKDYYPREPEPVIPHSPFDHPPFPYDDIPPEDPPFPDEPPLVRAVQESRGRGRGLRR